MYLDGVFLSGVQAAGHIQFRTSFNATVQRAIIVCWCCVRR